MTSTGRIRAVATSVGTTTTTGAHLSCGETTRARPSPAAFSPPTPGVSCRETSDGQAERCAHSPLDPIGEADRRAARRCPTSRHSSPGVRICRLPYGKPFVPTARRSGSPLADPAGAPSERSTPLPADHTALRSSSRAFQTPEFPIPAYLPFLRHGAAGSPGSRESPRQRCGRTIGGRRVTPLQSRGQAQRHAPELWRPVGPTRLPRPATGAVSDRENRSRFEPGTGAPRHLRDAGSPVPRRAGAWAGQLEPRHRGAFRADPA